MILSLTLLQEANFMGRSTSSANVAKTSHSGQSQPSCETKKNSVRKSKTGGKQSQKPGLNPGSVSFLNFIKLLGKNGEFQPFLPTT
jgi:hypothetical protein